MVVSAVKGVPLELQVISRSLPLPSPARHGVVYAEFRDTIYAELAVRRGIRDERGGASEG